MKKLCCTFVVAILTALPVGAKNIESISHLRIEQLRSGFRQAKTISTQLNNSRWSCKLYGVNSKLFTIEKNNFYSFYKSSKNQLNNNGSQLIKSYYPHSKGLWGRGTNIIENIRQLNSSTLISEISRPMNTQFRSVSGEHYTSIAFSKHRVLAYSICQKNS